MGGDKTKTTGESTQQYTMSPEERENVARLNRIGAAGEQSQIELNQAGMSDITKLLLGQDLPGYLQSLPYGIDEATIQSMTSKAINDIRPGFQNQGILDSGTALALSAKTAGDIRTGVQEFNLQNLLQLLNIGVGGQASTQSNLTSNASTLAAALQGTGTTNKSYSQTTMAMNPFLKSFQESAGKTLGSPKFSTGPFSFGG